MRGRGEHRMSHMLRPVISHYVVPLDGSHGMTRNVPRVLLWSIEPGMWLQLTPTVMALATPLTKCLGSSARPCRARAVRTYTCTPDCVIVPSAICPTCVYIVHRMNLFDHLQ